jgi:hypothetical protein
MYLPELSPYPYGKHPSKVSVGWLDRIHEYRRGATPDGFIARLSIFCHAPVLYTLGSHTCDFCQQATGTAEVWVFGADDTTYIAPDLVYHYVIEHHYIPPDAFIMAVMESPLPESPEYQLRVRQVREQKTGAG